MANIFVNGLNAKVGGGKSILNNYLLLLQENKHRNNYFVLTPNKQEYIKYENDFLKIVEIPKIFHKNIFFPIVYATVLDSYLKKFNIDVVFNLADIPIRTKTKQIFLFDWPYAVYPESIVWKMMDFKSLFNRKVKLFFFKRYMRYIDIMIAQTETMKSRLQKLYGFENIEVTPNAVSLENMSGGEYKDFRLSDGTKLLYLTHYYPHKNLEIFIPLAKEIKKQGLKYKLITTIESSQHIGARKFLEAIKMEKLEDTIINIGAIEMKHVPSLYQQCDGLLMPTLLESFGLTYLEAMYNKLTILTSNIDFATDVCRDSAYYFEPLKADDILKQVKKAFHDEKIRINKIGEGIKNLSTYLSWEEVLEQYEHLIEAIKK